MILITLLFMSFAIAQNAQQPSVTTTTLTTPSQYQSAYTLMAVGDTLYAGIAGNGVYRSTNGGTNWTAASNGLSSADVFSLMAVGNTLYAGAASNGVYRSTDGGNNWTAASNGLGNAQVLSLAAVGDILYAGTVGSGVYRSTDGGANWATVNIGLSDTNVRSLVAVGDTLYAGTFGSGVYRLTNDGANWAAANTGLSNADVYTLLAVGDTLYAGAPSRGVYHSTDDGANWAAANTDLSNADVYTLLAVGDTLYTGTNSGVYRSTDGGVNWAAANGDLSSNYVVALTALGDTLYAGTFGNGVYRSTNGGASWVAANTGLSSDGLGNVQVNTLVMVEDVLYVETDKGIYRSTDGGFSWKVTFETLPQPQTEKTFGGFMVRGNEIAPAVTDGIALTFENAFKPAIPAAQVVWYQVYGNTITRYVINDSPHAGQTYLWLAFRAWVFWLQINALGAAIVIFTLLTLASVNIYTSTIRPFGIPLWASILAPLNIHAWAKPHLLDKVYPTWANTIRAELRRWGDARPEDLLSVPWPYRRYALERYGAEQAADYTLDPRPNQLRLLNHERIKQWDKSWHTLSRALGQHAGLDESAWTPADSLAQLLAQTLGFNVLGAARTVGAVRAYFVEAPILRLNVPRRFPLLFLADPNPNANTVQALVDAVEVIREQGYFALVIPLEPSNPAHTIPSNLRQAINRSPHTNDFIVLWQDVVIELLMARQPEMWLAQLVVAQADLATRAPFVVRGPAPEQMFFGREAEIKQLVEGVPQGDFAVIGNRRIGKTSLLKRAEAKLRAEPSLRVWWVDCQAARTTHDFYAVLTEAVQPAAPITSPESFAAFIRQTARTGPRPTLLVDEVDAVLNDDEANDYRLAATWRALAQDGQCHFIFCGSTGLARRLRDSASPFFNFAHPLPLRYLEPATARLVLTQPLETLGIRLDNAEALLAEALSLTSGHPNLLQKVGYELVQTINQRGERRVEPGDVRALRQSSDFIAFYFDLVWGDAGPLERLITLTAPGPTFRLPDLEAALRAAGVAFTDTQLDAALDMLGVYAVLEKQGRDYGFGPKAFQALLAETQEVERLIRQQKERLK